MRISNNISDSDSTYSARPNTREWSFFLMICCNLETLARRVLLRLTFAAIHPSPKGSILLQIALNVQELSGTMKISIAWQARTRLILLVLILESEASSWSVANRELREDERHFTLTFAALHALPKNSDLLHIAFYRCYFRLNFTQLFTLLTP